VNLDVKACNKYLNLNYACSFVMFYSILFMPIFVKFMFVDAWNELCMFSCKYVLFEKTG
jgi:hypothetical protein